MKILVVNGPNLNLLGTREPEKYGSQTLKTIISGLKDQAKHAETDCEILDFQSNHEGAIIDTIQKNGPGCGYIIINPAAYTHTSIAIRDALLAVSTPVIEVHLTNIFTRDEFRHKSFISDIAEAVISGMGVYGYTAALDYIVKKSGKKL